ncbi:hypothetical protein MLD38_039545 [Melastoma candidum]|uniref:Uncharacterized protein n=1 Tax=Melastoma candidum TaxID=119954 RepID=A0ACB9L2D8_9MYRT|nr:hypothetical protein MLD38_039545 [Melastoma candidum]
MMAGTLVRAVVSSASRRPTSPFLRYHCSTTPLRTLPPTLPLLPAVYSAVSSRFCSISCWVLWIWLRIDEETSNQLEGLPGVNVRASRPQCLLPLFLLARFWIP